MWLDLTSDTRQSAAMESAQETHRGLLYGSAGLVLVAAAAWWSSRPTWTEKPPVDDGRAGGVSFSVQWIDRGAMWWGTMIGSVVVCVLAVLLRPASGRTRQLWAVLCGVAQAIANIRSPLWAVLVGVWTAVFVNNAGLPPRGSEEVETHPQP